jgi:5S rRNA maturation endonuclease (ribonuclease M5)
MTMMTKTKSYLNDQAKLKIVCDEICDNIESLLDSFEVEYKVNHKMISMCCPIHNGDNSSAVNLYPEGESYRGNWKCRTHNCEKIFKGSVIGFIRGIISSKKYGWEKSGDEMCSFKEAVDFATSFIKKDLSQIKISRSDRDKKQFSCVVNYFTNNNVKNDAPKIIRSQIIKTLEIPAQYYINRGFSKDILVKYDVGLCTNPKKEMRDRIVVPIYDNTHKYMVGCTGRSIYEKCNKCKCYHNPTEECPHEDYRWKYSKWKHNTDFKSQNHLYNLWFAREHILNSNTVIIVESPGNVWKLEENNIHNSVAIFGSSLSDRQKMLLDSSGAMNMIILTDNDDAGKKAADQIKLKCQNTYRIFIPTITKADVGEMTTEEINQEIKPLLESII